MGAASNGVGTVHDIHLLCQAARTMSDGNAFTFVDVPRFFPGSEEYEVVATQILFIFNPIPGEMIQFDDHIFQMGWFNHQPE